tara:strand:+ start:62 stop:337 length:276 start_codon:yes stop_codon:yes gene_type:complete
MGTKRKIKEVNKELKAVNWKIHDIQSLLYYANISLSFEEETSLEEELEELEDQRAEIISKLTSLKSQHTIIVGCLLAITIVLISMVFNYCV